MFRRNNIHRSMKFSSLIVEMPTDNNPIVVLPVPPYPITGEGLAQRRSGEQERRCKRAFHNPLSIELERLERSQPGPLAGPALTIARATLIENYAAKFTEVPFCCCDCYQKLAYRRVSRLTAASAPLSVASAPITAYKGDVVLDRTKLNIGQS